MVSTYLSYDLVNRDIQGSLKRISNQTQIANDAKYYQDNIGKITTTDEFLDDYRLYSYAMTAHGLEDMIYAKAFMKQVLESDLSDENSFANRLTDERYKSFAAAFNLGATGATGAVAQSEAQMDDVFGLYDQNIAALEEVSTEETRYFKVMLGTAGNITNVDQFLRNPRLREYMFASYGIDGTYFNYNTYRNILTSDPNDPNSYYNTAFGNSLKAYEALKLEDSELQERTAVIKAIPGIEESIKLGNEMKAKFEEELEAKRKELEEGGDPAKLQPEIDTLEAKIKAAQTLIDQDIETLEEQNVRLEELNTKLVPVDQTQARRAEIAAELKAMPIDLNFSRKMKALAEDFQFNADGTIPPGGALSDPNMDKVVTGFFDSLSRMTHAEAMFNQEYFESKIGTVSNVDDLLDDPRMYNYLRAAFGLDEAYIVKSTLEQILISDLSDPNSVANQYAKERPGYLELAKAFNFDTDGTVKDGGVQTTQQATTTRSNYMSRWDDKQEVAHEKAVKFYKSDMVAIDTLDEFMSPDAKTTYEFALKAVGIDPASVSKFKIRSVLTSDLSDPNSYVYKLEDPRFVSLAKLFNFDTDGDVTVPVLAQSNATITSVAADYILRSTRYLEGEELKVARKKADEEASYYTKTMQGLDNRDQLLGNRRVLDIILTAEGIDKETITDDFLEQLFLSDINDPNSFVNQQDDKRFAQIVGSFNFDEKGEIDRSKGGSIQNGGEVAATHALYLRQTLEAEQGMENPGVRLALYFQRMADTITDPYAILADDALAEFFRVTFGLPEEFSNINVDQQAKLIEKHLNIEDLSDPEKLSKLVERFTALYDIQYNSGASSAAASILGGSGSMGISADTLWALSQIRR